MIKLQSTTTKYKDYALTEARGLVNKKNFRLFLAKEKDGKVTIL